MQLYKKIISIILFIVLLLVPFDVSAKYRVSCKAMIFSDRTKVVRLYGKNVHERVIPASTTKVMTALLVLEKLSLNEFVTVSHRATLPQPTKLYMSPGDQYRVRDLLFAIILNSANDASVVLAEAVAGSESKFVEMMNARAKQIGARHTKFANSHGLPTKKVSQYTTAYDMYMIFREALKFSFFREAIKMKYRTIYSKSGQKHSLKSHNKILFKGWKRDIYGKTGYTHSAGPCFVGTLQKGDSTLIVAAFGCPNRWEDIKHVVSRYGGISL
ncbi:MAG: D-alanyl-D-alanine carboxypeptidase family protein [Candidatus Omnitrophota bacterium]